MSKRFLLFVVVVLVLAAALWMFPFGDEKVTRPAAAPAGADAPALESAPQPESRESGAIASISELSDRLRGGDKKRWFSVWRASLSRMSANELWALANDPSLVNSIEAKSLRDKLVSGCVVSSSVREFSTAVPGLIDDWCKQLRVFGGTDFLRDQMGVLMHDLDLASSVQKSVGPRKLRGTEAERRDELMMLEGVFRTASDPWTLGASARALWSYQSTLLLDDWSKVNSLSGFQRDRLRLFVQADAACRATGDCDAGSVWLVELCAFTPGLQCASGSNLDSLVAQNLSPLEAETLRQVSGRIARAHAAAMAQ